MACKESNPLIRKGVDRLSRRLAALSPGSAPVDDRSIQDLMLFAKRYAAFLHYKDQDNQNDGTWESLMGKDISVVLSVLLAIDVFELSDYVKLLNKKIKLAISSDDEDEAKRQFKYLFDCLFTLAHTIDEQCTLLRDEEDYQQVLQFVIKNKLNLPFTRLHNFFKDHQELILQTNKTDASAPLLTISSRGTFDWVHFEIGPENLPITISGSTVVERISTVINHNIFNHQISILFNGVSNVLQKASGLLEKSLTAYSKHQPHYALFLTFLKLFSYAQESLNEFSKKHLDFYYKDVLRLKNKPPKPDQAHLVLQLQKHINRHLLPKGTIFKGTKDSEGIERLYALESDTVFNQAEVQSLKGFHLAKNRLLSFAALNSTDGQGEDFEGDDESWRAFGRPSSPPSDGMGFGIASNLLFLREGERKITLEIRLSNTSRLSQKITQLIGSRRNTAIPFKVLLTGEEDWIEQQVNGSFHTSTNILTIFIHLDVEVPSVVPYAQNIHEGNFQTSLPLLQVIFDQANSNVDYADLMDANVDSIQVRVEVLGMKSLALSNDRGSLDASKPFKPFGDFPDEGASFYMGSKEIFQKRLTSLKVHLPITPSVTCSFLHKNQWKTGYTFDNTSKTVTAGTGANLLEQTKMDFGKDEFLKVGAFEGFLRFRLNSKGYSLDDHMRKVNAYIEQMMRKAGGDSPQRSRIFTQKMELKASEGETSSISLPFVDFKEKDIKISEADIAGYQYHFNHIYLADDLLFYTDAIINLKASIPVPNELIAEFFKVDYAASENILSPVMFPERHEFLHLNPFGHRSAISEGGRSLIPRFHHEGELLIGIGKTDAPVTLQLLFLLVDGSSNPLKVSETVHWAYLNQENQWTEFEDQDIIDGTINLTRSGIVQVKLPKNATQKGTWLPSGNYWIKASVDENTDAVCRIISVEAQGALVTLLQDDKLEFRELQEAESIAKLKRPDAMVKSVVQPADSFGGRAREADEDYYLRTSERLRHKGRAISIWDFEHLIMEEFPQVHKAKCLNHTGFYHRGSEKIFCENFPGHVSIVCIPDLKNRTHINPLRPYTSIGTLTDISLFLEKIKNPFVRLHVVNPSFEEVRVEFEVKFHDQLDEVFYKNLLDMELEQFLCPWAFDLNQDISLGGSIHKSTLINFVEERSYVDFVSCFKIHHIIRDDEGKVVKNLPDQETITASTGRSVLVSHFDEALPQPKHKIKVIETCNC